MCGFVLSINDTNVDIRALTESIKHRGPDSTKYYTGSDVLCGFNRLAIVDNDNQSDQPMLDNSGRYLLLFNGEIYNYPALKKQIESRHNIQLKTQSDTEVLLYGLIHEGLEYISKLDGIFAFAFVDLKSLEVVLARDMFGVKPLYYYSNNKHLYVSSEIKPLRQLTQNNLEFSNLSRYLSYGFVGNGEALVSGITELEANTIKTFSAEKKAQTFKIRDFTYDQHETIALDEISDLLYKTIDAQKPSIPYGVLFSGGLDSTLILDRCFEDSHFAGAYSIDVNHADMSEKHWQSYVVNTLGMRAPYRRIDLNKTDFSLENMEKIARNLDYPLFHPNFIGSYLLTQTAAQDGLKVLLSGEGADELFIGYRWFFTPTPPAEFLEYVPLLDIQNILRANETTALPTTDMSLLEIFQKKYLQRWLLRQDLTGMANSVEVRVPFLGLQLAELINKLSFQFKKGTGQSKWIIKKFLADKFSPEFIERKKVGFDFPLNEWIDADHIDYLRQKTDLIDVAVLDATLNKYEKSYYKNRIVFSLVSFALWHDNLIRPTSRKEKEYTCQTQRN